MRFFPNEALETAATFGLFPNDAPETAATFGRFPNDVPEIAATFGRFPNDAPEIAATFGRFLVREGARCGIRTGFGRFPVRTARGMVGPTQGPVQEQEQEPVQDDQGQGDGGGLAVGVSNMSGKVDAQGVTLTVPSMMNSQVPATTSKQAVRRELRVVKPLKTAPSQPVAAVTPSSAGM